MVGVPCEQSLFDLPTSVGKRKRLCERLRYFLLSMLQTKISVTEPRRASLSGRNLEIDNTMLSRGLPRAFREHFDSHGFHAVQFNREFAQCLQLAKNTDKEVFFKIRSKATDTICLVCAISLIGERCTFNIEQHSGLRQKLESVLEHDIDFKASSSRICRPCGP